MIKKAGLLLLALLCAVAVFGCGGTAAEPCRLLEFEAADGEISEQRLSDVSLLEVGVNHCEYGEPTQYIEDERIISAVIKALSEMTVTGLKDKVDSTESYVWYNLRDAKGKSVCSFSFQDGLLMGEDGRYSVEGLDALEAVDGIMLIGDWRDYWIADSEKRDDFEASYRISYPSTVFEVSGYSANQLYHDVAREDVASVRVWIASSELPALQSEDREVIGAIYDALCQMQVLQEAVEDPEGESWYVAFSYKEPGESFYGSARLRFCGSLLESDFAESGDVYYEVSGLDALLDAVDAETLEYLK